MVTRKTTTTSRTRVTVGENITRGPGPGGEVGKSKITGRTVPVLKQRTPSSPATVTRAPIAATKQAVVAPAMKKKAAAKPVAKKAAAAKPVAKKVAAKPAAKKVAVAAKPAARKEPVTIRYKGMVVPVGRMPGDDLEIPTIVVKSVADTVILLDKMPRGAIWKTDLMSVDASTISVYNRNGAHVVDLRIEPKK